MAPALMRMNLGLFIFYKTDFAIIKDRIEATPSEDLRESCTYQEFAEIVTETLMKICLDVVLKNKAKTGKHRSLNVLRR